MRSPLDTIARKLERLEQLAEIELEQGEPDEGAQSALAAVVACSQLGQAKLNDLRRRFPKTANNVDRMLASALSQVEQE